MLKVFFCDKILSWLESPWICKLGLHRYSIGNFVHYLTSNKISFYCKYCNAKSKEFLLDDLNIETRDIILTIRNNLDEEEEYIIKE